MTEDLVRLLDGNTFVVSDENGDIDASPTIPTGLFSFDTRFLSRWVLSINGERVSALTAEEVEYFEARFFVVATVPTPLVDTRVAAIRERSIGESFLKSNCMGTPRVRQHSKYHFRTLLANPDAAVCARRTMYYD